MVISQDRLRHFWDSVPIIEGFLSQREMVNKLMEIEDRDGAEFADTLLDAWLNLKAAEDGARHPLEAQSQAYAKQHGVPMAEAYQHLMAEKPELYRSYSEFTKLGAVMTFDRPEGRAEIGGPFGEQVRRYRKEHPEVPEAVAIKATMDAHPTLYREYSNALKMAR